MPTAVKYYLGTSCAADSR